MQNNKKLHRFIGDKAFYALMLSIAIPVMLQNGITSFVNLLDNLMVGQVGTEQMSGVAIVNQILFIFNLCIFGANSGAGIFCSQFFGSGNIKGIRDAFRFKVIVNVAITIIGIAVCIPFCDTLIGIFLHDGSQSGNLALTLQSGRGYLMVMLTGLIFFAMKEAYAGTMREMGKTFIPMLSGIIAVLVNLLLNYILIFGKFGAPALGVLGAAIATVLSRVVECIIVVVYTHIRKKDFPFIVGAYRQFSIPLSLCKQITVKGLPLLANEALWSFGMTFLMQCYSVRGLAVIAGINISSTFGNMFSTAFFAMGTTMSILTGKLLGAGKFEEAKITASRLLTFGVSTSIVLAIAVIALAPVLPALYNTTAEVRALAASFLVVYACTMPIHAFNHASYFALRSGGKTMITFVFDAGFTWLISVPLAFCLSRFTGMPIVPLYAIVQGADFIKSIFGLVLLKKGTWIHNLVGE